MIYTYDMAHIDRIYDIVYSCFFTICQPTYTSTQNLLLRRKLVGTFIVITSGSLDWRVTDSIFDTG